VQNNFNSLVALKQIHICNCQGLHSIALSDISTDCAIKITECKNLLKVSLEASKQAAAQPTLTALYLTKCPALRYVGVVGFKMIKVLRIWQCSSLGLPDVHVAAPELAGRGSAIMHREDSAGFDGASQTGSSGSLAGPSHRHGSALTAADGPQENVRPPQLARRSSAQAVGISWSRGSTGRSAMPGQLHPQGEIQEETDEEVASLAGPYDDARPIEAEAHSISAASQPGAAPTLGSHTTSQSSHLGATLPASLPALTSKSSAVHVREPRVREVYINECRALRLPFDQLRDLRVFEVMRTSDHTLRIKGQMDYSLISDPLPGDGTKADDDCDDVLQPEGCGMALRCVSIAQCDQLQRAMLLGCPRATTFSIKRCPVLRYLALQCNSSLTSASVVSCTAIQDVLVDKCSSLTALDLYDCNKLGSVQVQECPAMLNLLLGHSEQMPHAREQQRLPNLQKKQLQSLHLHDLLALQTLVVGDTGKVSSLDLTSCPALVTVKLERCTELAELNLEDCTSLNTVYLRKCRKLTSLLMGNVPDLTELQLLECNALPLLPESLQYCKRLTHVSIIGSQVLTRLQLRSPALATLRVVSCPELTVLTLAKEPDGEQQGTPADKPATERLSLQELDVRHCIKLQKLPNVFNMTPDLTQVRIRHTAVNELPSSFSFLEDGVLDPDNHLSRLQRDMDVARSRSDASRTVSALLVGASLSGLSVVASQLQAHAPVVTGHADMMHELQDEYPRGVWGCWVIALIARIVWLFTALTSLCSLAIATWLMNRIDAAKGIQQVFLHDKLHRQFKFVLKLPERLVLVTVVGALFGLMFTAANYAQTGWSAIVFAVASAAGVAMWLVRHFLEHRWKLRPMKEPPAHVPGPSASTAPGADLQQQSHDQQCDRAFSQLTVQPQAARC
jgi:hypothetical protein